MLVPVAPERIGGAVDRQACNDAVEVIQDLMDIVSRSGGMQLNLGPKADGTIPEVEVEAFLAIGAWLGTDGEAIYGARCWRLYGEGPKRARTGDFSYIDRSPYTAEDVRFTRRDDTVYAMTLDPPRHAGPVVLPDSKCLGGPMVVLQAALTAVGRNARPAWRKIGAAGQAGTRPRSATQVQWRITICEEMMAVAADAPLTVQSDRTILLEVDHERAEEARQVLAGFAELLTSPEHVHTYRLSALSLWNAASAGLHGDGVLEDLARLSRYPIPGVVGQFIREQMERYGQLRLLPGPDGLELVADRPELLVELHARGNVRPLLGERTPRGFGIDPILRGQLKQTLAHIGWPLQDEAGFTPGAPLPLALRTHEVTSGEPFSLRPYQLHAVGAFYGDGRLTAGDGVVVLPCGAGKTLVGIGIMAKIQSHTLILTTSVAAIHQWRRELLERTDLTPEDIGEYTAATKEIRPVTLTTYQMLAHRSKGEYLHFYVMDSADWGLVIYDEVHLLPAPIFRMTASIQSRRRLGLTATLLREDGHAEDVFALIGPKRYDAPWRALEAQGWIAPALCHEIRVPLPDSLAMVYAAAEDRDRARVAAENPAKESVVEELLASHAHDHVLVIGQYLDQLNQVASRIEAPLITGKSPPAVREQLYEDFRQGRVPRLVVSKVANFAIDLPDANVAIQISGTFGSRQEEAQRLGRILRPKSDGGPAYFYSIVTEDTVEQQFAQKRQLFLTEQGYRYRIAHAAGDGRPAERTPAPVIQFPSPGGGGSF